MKRLGIIGGIGPESTIVYYRSIIAAGVERSVGASPSVLINSIDVRTVLRLVEDNALTVLTDYLVAEIGILARADVSLALIAANTPHIVFDAVRRRCSIPLLSIVEATRDAARARGLTRLGLLGTRFTMQGRFYPEIFSASGIELACPRPEEQAYIHEKYVGELLNNVFLPATREGLLNVVHALKERDGAQGIILAGTELPFLLAEDSASAIPFLDTTKIHVAAAAQHLWG